MSQDSNPSSQLLFAASQEHGPSRLILTMVLGSWYHHYSLFSEEETEAQEGKMPSSRSPVC